MLHCVWGSHIRSLFVRSIWTCMAWLMPSVLCLFGNARWTANMLRSRWSNLLQRRLHEVSFGEFFFLNNANMNGRCKTHYFIMCHHLNARRIVVKFQMEFNVGFCFLFLFKSSKYLDLHSVPSANERSHQPIGFAAQSNMCSIWHAFHAILAIVSFQPAKNSP